MRPTIFNPIVVWAVTLVATLTGHAETLPEAVSTALQQNPGALAAALAEEAALEEIEVARGGFFPTADLRASSGPGFRDRGVEGLSSNGDWLYSDEARLTIRQRLFDGKATRKRVESAESLAGSANFAALQTREEVALGVAEAYLNVMRNQELIEASIRNISAHQKSLDNAQTRADAGGERSDVSLVSGRLALAKSSLESRKASLKAATVRYERFVGRPPSNLSMPSSPQGVPGSIESMDPTGNYAYQAATEVAKAREAEVVVQKAARKPRIDFEARGGVGNDVQGIEGEDNESSFLIVGSWTIFDKARDPRIEAARRRAEEASLSAEETRLVAEQMAGEGWSEYIGARARTRVLAEYKSDLGDVFDDYEKQFDIGKRSFLNLLDIQTERFRAESAYIDAKYQTRLAEYRTLSALGRLLSALGIHGGK